jgi:hypothetical protein
MAKPSGIKACQAIAKTLKLRLQPAPKQQHLGGALLGRQLLQFRQLILTKHPLGKPVPTATPI